MRSFRFSYWMTMAGVGSGALCAHLPAQNAPTPPSAAATADAGKNNVSTTNDGPKSAARPRGFRGGPPKDDPAKPPMAFFRGLLAMTPDERELALAGKPPEDQKKLLEKISEYESLKPEDRELRLRSTDLGWHVTHLIHSSPTNRADWLAKMPANDRPLVEDRLEQWDQLSPEAQNEFLKNERL